MPAKESHFQIEKISFVLFATFAAYETKHPCHLLFTVGPTQANH